MVKCKKSFAMILAVILTITLFAACGKSSVQTAGSSTASAKSTTADKTETPVIKILFTKGGFEAPPANDIIKQQMEKDSGVKFEFISPPSANYTEKLHLILASGDLPDIAALNLKNDVFKYAEEDLLLDLKPYMDLMPDIKKLIPQSAMDYYTVDEKLIAIPKWTTTKRYNMIIRNDWLKKLNLKVPTTLDELHDVLAAFVNKDPDGNKIKDTYGISGLGLDAFDYIFGAYGVIMGETSWNAPDTHCNIYFSEKDGKLIPQATLPETKDALTLLAKWYSEGLIDPEFASQKPAVYDEKMVSNRYGVTTYWWNWDAQREVAMKAIDPNAELLRIAPPTGPNGLSGLRAVPEVVCGVSVMKTTKYPKECVKFMNYLHTEKGMLTSYTGVEGVHWEQKDGKYLTLPQFDKDNKWIQWYFLFENEQPLYKVETYLAPSRRDALKWNVISDAASAISTDAQIKYTNDLTALVADYFTRFITGKTPLTSFDKFVSDFNSRGGQEWTDQVNKIYQSKKK